MVLERQVFTYKDKPLIEKVRVKTPFRYEAIFPNEGCFLYIVGAQTNIYSTERITQINEKQGVLLKCGNYFVDWIKDANSEVIEVFAFHLDYDILRELYKQELPQLVKNRVNGEQVTYLADDAVIAKFIDNLQFYFDRPALVNEDLLELKVKELILLLLGSKNASSITELMSDLFSPRTVQIKDVIKTHIFSNLSVSELAQLCGLSHSSFKREFEKIYNQSPNKYLLEERIRKASELLKTTSQSVSEIAYATGFNDPAYFARIFRKKLGSKPTDYRTKN